MKALAIAALSAALGACATEHEPIVREVTVRVPQEVRVNVPVPCIKPEDVPALPSLASDEQLDGLSDRDLVLTIEKQRRELNIYRVEVAALINRCMRPPVSLRGATP